jgi:hypothetical protein
LAELIGKLAGKFLTGPKKWKGKGLGWFRRGDWGGWGLDSGEAGVRERLFTGVLKLEIRIETLRAEG